MGNPTAAATGSYCGKTSCRTFQGAGWKDCCSAPVLHRPSDRETLNCSIGAHAMTGRTLGGNAHLTTCNRLMESGPMQVGRPVRSVSMTLRGLELQSKESLVSARTSL